MKLIFKNNQFPCRNTNVDFCDVRWLGRTCRNPRFVNSPKIHLRCKTNILGQLSKSHSIRTAFGRIYIKKDMSQVQRNPDNRKFYRLDFPNADVCAFENWKVNGQAGC